VRALLSVTPRIARSSIRIGGFLPDLEAAALSGGETSLLRLGPLSLPRSLLSFVVGRLSGR